MRVTKKNQQQNGHREIVDAVKALCSERISSRRFSSARLRRP